MPNGGAFLDVVFWGCFGTVCEHDTIASWSRSRMSGAGNTLNTTLIKRVEAKEVPTTVIYKILEKHFFITRHLGLVRENFLITRDCSSPRWDY